VDSVAGTRETTPEAGMAAPAGPAGYGPGYREFSPPAQLGHALHCIWISVAPPDGGERVPVLPDACSDLIWQSGAGVLVAGPDTRPFPFQLQPGTVLVGARFRPGAGGAALGVPLSELLNVRVDAAELPAVPSARLPASLAPEEAIRRVARVAAWMVTERPPDPLVLEAARRLGVPGARADLVAGSLGISERQLRRRCQAAAGYGPRTLARVLRFRRFLSRVDAGEAADLAGVAADAGYADQAHLSRESTRLAGLPPAALARARRRA
jgi:AraC-like DNA-binding protein